jgi:hypothetical protein
MIRARAYKLLKQFELAMQDINLAIDIAPEDKELHKEKQSITEESGGSYQSRPLSNQYTPPVNDLTTVQDLTNVIALPYDPEAKDVRRVTIDERPLNVDYVPSSGYVNEDEELQRAIEASIISEQLRIQAQEQIQEHEQYNEEEYPQETDFDDVDE